MSKNLFFVCFFFYDFLECSVVLIRGSSRFCVSISDLIFSFGLFWLESKPMGFVLHSFAHFFSWFILIFYCLFSLIFLVVRRVKNAQSRRDRDE